jgi:hypothetical protein
MYTHEKMCVFYLFSTLKTKKTKTKEKRDRAKRDGGCFGLKKKEKEKWWVVYMELLVRRKKKKRNGDIERFEFLKKCTYEIS